MHDENSRVLTLSIRIPDRPGTTNNNYMPGMHVRETYRFIIRVSLKITDESQLSLIINPLVSIQGRLPSKKRCFCIFIVKLHFKVTML